MAMSLRTDLRSSNQSLDLQVIKRRRTPRVFRIQGQSINLYFTLLYLRLSRKVWKKATCTLVIEMRFSIYNR